MKTTDIIHFLSELKDNNNREWFALNKERYEETRKHFEKISSDIAFKISQFDDEIKHVDIKECIFRIYRDTRFSHDKTPYKTHYGVFIAAGGGRKSVRGGYYIHFEPGASFIAVGVWCPPPELLKALRETIYENIEELKEIIEDKSFVQHFKTFYDEDKLKTAPKGFPKDFPDIELLKLKHYMVECKLTDDMFMVENISDKIVDILQIAYPLNKFLNYTVDETPLNPKK
jgi:uncharacterized protein (TIGR02453 family)